MSRPSRSYLAVAAAIVIAGVLISASLLVALGTGKTTTETTFSTSVSNGTPTSTVLIQTTSTETTTSTAIVTRTATDTVTSTVFEGSQTSVNTSAYYRFYYSISVNYSGSWNLVYWGQNGTLTQSNEAYCNACYGGVIQYNVYGGLSGSGDYQTGIVTWGGVPSLENEFCVEATILNTSTGTLTLSVLGKTGIATASLNPTVELCVTMAV